MNYSSKAAALGMCAWLGLLAVGGCSSSADDAGPVPLDQFPQVFAKAHCDALKPCCGKAGLAFADAECRGRMTESYTNYVTQNGGPNTKYDPDAAGKCLSAMQKALGSCIEDTSAPVDHACDGVFSGLLPNGSVCQSDAACGSHICDRNAETPVCVAPGSGPGHAKAGEVCGQTCEAYAGEDPFTPGCFGSGGVGSAGTCYVADGLYCPNIVMLDIPPVCTKIPGLGESCDSYFCAPGTFCEASQDLALPATCVAQRDSGPCNASDVCSAKSYCSADQSGFGSGECLAKKPDGYACQGAAECKSGSCGGGTATHRTCGPASVADAASCSGVQP